MVLDKGKTPCMNCEARRRECHADCEAYLAFRARIESIKAEYRKTIPLNEFVAANTRRAKRKTKKK